MTAMPGKKQKAWLEEVAATMMRGPSEADVLAAAQRVAERRSARPDRTTDQLVDDVIASTMRRTAAIGAATAGTALVPGMGTVAALTLGAATDVGATLRLQTQMVLDLAALRGAELTPAQARNALLVVIGVSSAGRVALDRAGRKAALTLGERFTARWLLRAVPVVGMLSSSGANALATRVIGNRADAYFRAGPEAVVDWRASVRAVLGRRQRTRLPKPARLPAPDPPS
jgi:uncharacterized protein (DUF697 family)